MTERITSLMGRFFTQEIDNLGSWYPGVVVGWNRTDRLVNVDPLVLRDPPIPQAVNLPVLFPGVYWEMEVRDPTGQITHGTEGIVLLGWYDWRSAWQTGEQRESQHDGTHQISSGVFVPTDGLTLPIVSLADHGLILGSKVILSPDLRLSTYDANERVLRGDEYTSQEDTWVNALDTFLSAMVAAIAAGVPVDPAAILAYAGASTAFRARVDQHCASVRVP